ncbi:hypothetical protein V1506DRAFT_540003 [Lipomyces tetrasporus]
MNTSTSSQPPSARAPTRPHLQKMPQQQLYCICRKPDTGQWMIACDFCDEWYHGVCVSIREAQSDLIETYACPACTSKRAGTTTWKRKCRLPDCDRPALVDGDKKSKFCTAEHGVEWFKLNMDAHAYDDDDDGDGLRNDRIAPGELAAVVRLVANVREFKRLGDVPPVSGSPSLTADDKFRLAMLNGQRAEIDKRLAYVEHKARYIEYAKLRATAQKNVCGFDRKLVWDDAEWAEWCDSDEGVRILARIREFKAAQDDKVAAAAAVAAAADERNGRVNGGDKRKRGRKANQQVAVQLDLREILAVVGNTGDDDVCMVERRRCSRHTSWQHIRAEEVELDERVCRDALVKIERDEQAIKQRAGIRSFKDSTKSGGRCIVVN